MKNLNFLLLFALTILLSCSGNHYDVYQSINISNPWMSTDTLNFHLSCSQLENRSLEIVVEHDDDFKYENLYIGISSPDQPLKTISIPLSNRKGQWIGNKSGNRYTVSYPIEDTKLENEMAFQIIHYAREKVLNGIHVIGLGVAQSEH